MYMTEGAMRRRAVMAAARGEDIYGNPLVPEDDRLPAGTMTEEAMRRRAIMTASRAAFAEGRQLTDDDRARAIANMPEGTMRRRAIMAGIRDNPPAVSAASTQSSTPGVRERKLFQRYVTTYSLVLKGRNRHMRCNFSFDHLTHCRAEGSTITYLPGFLRSKFGEMAVGIKVMDAVYDDDEEMMRDGHIKTDQSYYVIYEDYAPAYTEAIESPPLYVTHPAAALHASTGDGGVGRVSTLPLPAYDDPVLLEPVRRAYHDTFIYYTDIPLRSKTFFVKLTFGRRGKIVLTNKETAQPDGLRHQLMALCGHRARGVHGESGELLENDDALWSDQVRDGKTYAVAYIKTNVLSGTPIDMPNHPQQQDPESIPAEADRPSLFGRL